MNRILNDAGFRTHLTIYIAVNAGLALINLFTAPTHVWFQWPLIGWGVGLLGHAFLISRAPEAPTGAGRTDVEATTAPDTDATANRIR